MAEWTLLYDGQLCGFCEVIAGTREAEVLEIWDDAIAISTLNPVTPGHAVIVPRVHVRDATVNPEVTAAAMRRLAQFAKARGEQCNLSMSVGPLATQTAPHLHLHYVPRRVGDELALPWSRQEDNATSAADARQFQVMSFGYLHAGAPRADLVIDLRPRLRDPHTDPTMKQLTGHHDRIIRQVEATPGYADIVETVVDAAIALADAGEQQVRIAVGCAGGRHRSVVVAEALARELVEMTAARASEVAVRHLDIHQPVVERGGAR